MCRNLIIDFFVSSMVSGTDKYWMFQLVVLPEILTINHNVSSGLVQKLIQKVFLPYVTDNWTPKVI